MTRIIVCFEMSVLTYYVVNQYLIIDLLVYVLSQPTMLRFIFHRCQKEKDKECALFGNFEVSK